MTTDPNPYQPGSELDVGTGGHPVADKSGNTVKKTPISAHFMCGWPFLMVSFGGAIGGGLGGGAYAINMAIYKSEMPVPVKIVLNLFTGVAAFGIWFAIVLATQMARS